MCGPMCQDRSIASSGDKLARQLWGQGPAGEESKVPAQQCCLKPGALGCSSTRDTGLCRCGSAGSPILQMEH